MSAAVVAVLAGGRGRRMGGDKALVELDGEPLVLPPLRAALERGAAMRETLAAAQAR